MNDRDCGRIFAILSQYLDRELPQATCGELEVHLHDCPECVQFVNSLKSSVALCRGFGASRDAVRVEPDKLAELRAAYERMLARRK